MGADSNVFDAAVVTLIGVNGFEIFSVAGFDPRILGFLASVGFNGGGILLGSNKPLVLVTG